MRKHIVYRTCPDCATEYSHPFEADPSCPKCMPTRRFSDPVQLALRAAAIRRANQMCDRAFAKFATNHAEKLAAQKARHDALGVRPLREWDE